VTECRSSAWTTWCVRRPRSCPPATASRASPIPQEESPGRADRRAGGVASADEHRPVATAPDREPSPGGGPAHRGGCGDDGGPDGPGAGRNPPGAPSGASARHGDRSRRRRPCSTERRDRARHPLEGGDSPISPSRPGPPLGALALDVIVWVCSRWREGGEPRGAPRLVHIEALAQDLGWRKGGGAASELAWALDTRRLATLGARVYNARLGAHSARARRSVVRRRSAAARSRGRRVPWRKGAPAR